MSAEELRALIAEIQAAERQQGERLERLYKELAERGGWLAVTYGNKDFIKQTDIAIYPGDQETAIFKRLAWRVFEVGY